MRPRARPGPGGWPLPPPLSTAWMARRAVWWLRLMRAGRVDRFHRELTALSPRRAVPGQDRLLAYADDLRREWRTRTEAGPAGPALIRAGHPNYLGSRPVVRGLVDGYFALLIARAGGAVPYEACEAELRRLARIFAGLDPAFAVIGGWNTRGQLGDAAIEWVPLDQAGPTLESVLQEAFAAVGLRVMRMLRAAEQSEVAADAALTELSQLAESVAALLMGSTEAA
ncbi:MAG: hypothetical protein H7Z10_06055 [Gemmatimonadaceae bacterium]|nr:hypothetical protein [Acetobacteraceae bacterium]